MLIPAFFLVAATLDKGIQIKALQLWWCQPRAICIIHWFMWGGFLSCCRSRQEHAGTEKLWQIMSSDSEIKKAAVNTVFAMISSRSLDSWIKTSLLHSEMKAGAAPMGAITQPRWVEETDKSRMARVMSEVGRADRFVLPSHTGMV